MNWSYIEIKSDIYDSDITILSMVQKAIKLARQSINCNDAINLISYVTLYIYILHNTVIHGLSICSYYMVQSINYNNISRVTFLFQ